MNPTRAFTLSLAPRAQGDAGRYAGEKMIPEYWMKFINTNNLIGASIEVPEEIDLSELGIEMGILTAEMCISEAEEAYPGIVVCKDGYIPVGSCLSGSGDYYYINVNDGGNGPLYRIYHDSVSDDGYDKDEAIDVVLDNYKKITEYTEA